MAPTMAPTIWPSESAIFGRYLPPEIAEHDAEECRAREPLILQLLSSTLAEKATGSWFRSAE